MKPSSDELGGCGLTTLSAVTMSGPCVLGASAVFVDR